MMKKKRILLFLMIMILAAGSLSAQITQGVEPEFRPRLPELMAQGTSFTANAHGYGALFTNPAGFAMGEGDFTLLSVTGAIRANPFRLSKDMQTLEPEYESPEALMTEALSRQLSTNGIGSQVSAGMGIVGKGLGLGLISTLEADAQGKTQMGTDATAYWTVAAPLGYAVNLEPVEGYKLSVGGDLRPMWRMAIETSAADLLNMASGSGGMEDFIDKPARTGTALAFDVGAILQMDKLRVGVSIRDLFGTEFAYQEAPLGAFVDEPGYENVEPTSVEGYGIPAMARVGAAYYPEFDIFILSDPVVHAEYEVPFMPKDGDGEPLAPAGTIFTNLNMGGEIKFLKFMSLQAGLTSGYLTGGLGVDLLFLELNIAGYTEEMGPRAGDNPASGMTVEMAFRF